MTEPAWLAKVVGRVNARLEAYFREQRTRAEVTSPRLRELVDMVADLTLRGGKRLRPAALVAGMRAVDAEKTVDDALDACAALELLQTYLLIQDDWMDHDETRRGAPAVHAELTRRYGADLGPSMAILAGDLASAWSWALCAHAPFAPTRLGEALALLAHMNVDVVSGQQLDLLGHDDVALTHRLKTSSYTVRGPLRLGALLANADETQLHAFDAYAEPLGLAFQLRDDVLGTFGAGEVVGKPVGADLRAGKRTALVADALAHASEADRAVLEGVLGRANASDAEVARASAVLAGARDGVETRISALRERALAALDATPFAEEGRRRLGDLAELLTARVR